MYLSDCFERNRASYYDALTQVRESNNILHWVRFFLTAVIETANNGIATFEAILALRQQMDALIVSYGRRAQNCQILINRLYRRPAITVNDSADLLGASHTTANKLIEQLMADDVLVELTGYQRNRVYLFNRYLALF